MVKAFQLPSPYRLVELDCVDSTNEEAKRLAKSGAPDSTVVWAKRQTAGRGRRGREWVSGSGNLYFSIILRPPYPMKDAVQLSFVAANAVADAIDVLVPRGTFVHVKWPNDVLIEGKKVSGILMEGEASTQADRFEWLVFGVGVNVVSHPQNDGFDVLPTSLRAEGVDGKGMDIQALLDTLVKRFWAGLVTWRNLGFGPIRRHWLSRAEGLGKAVIVRLPHETLHGVFAALDDCGALVLHQDGLAPRLITAGDVFMVNEPR